ncbi:hypothetical protein ACLMJK_007350 [Lecanora helva]
MARLNEPPQPATESVDALKRRFVRQNREIARANSTQSVRIRNLECEVSQLLGENVSLREEVIKLQNELEKNTNKNVRAGVDSIKGKLEAKLSEIGALVQNLGEVQKTTDIRRAQKRRSINRTSPKTSPDQKVWKNTMTLSEAVGCADDRLPPIMEDKYYPRRTMDAEELLGVMADPANITDSPDLGPPPIAHFEQGDPIKYDTPREEAPKQDWLADDEGAPPQLSANLETRRKRRESYHPGEGDISKSIPAMSKRSVPQESISVDQPLKSGAKRKLNVREEEDRPEPRRQRDDNPLQSFRKSADSRRTDRGDSKAGVDENGKNVTNKPSAAPPSTRSGNEKQPDAPATDNVNRRKALGPKSVNSDPMNSPLKHRKADSKDRLADAKEDVAKIVQDRSRAQDKAPPKTAKQSGKDAALANLTAMTTRPKALVEPPPETPVAPPSDVFSPGNSEPSAPRNESRDTPPPPDLGPDTGTGSFGRASRRPKGSVNYAQPNLRDKMRRPTAELVDAVAAEERARQVKMAAKAEKDAADAMVIKQEDFTDGVPIWKTGEVLGYHGTAEDPVSPLNSKTVESSKELPPTVITERRRRTIAPSRTEVEAPANASISSGAGSAIAALSAGNHKSKRNEEQRSKPPLTVPEEKHDLTERPSIYDFTGSSPNNGAHDEEIGTTKVREEEVPKPARSSRRHSTVVPATSDQGKGTLSISRCGTVGERRRESLLSGNTGRKDAIAGTGLMRTNSLLDLGPGAAEGGEESETAVGAGSSRGERAASRRRSMML